MPRPAGTTTADADRIQQLEKENVVTWIPVHVFDSAPETGV
jgi:hypothetical protein